MKKICLFIIFLFSLSISHSQQVLNTNLPEDFKDSLEEKKTDKLFPYTQVEKKDMAFFKTLWEVIDLNEKINQVYYYRSDEFTNACESLYNVLLKGIENEKIKTIYEDDNFSIKIDNASLKERLTHLEITDLGKEISNQGGKLTDEHFDQYEIRSSSVKRFKIKGIWYFDRRIGEMQYRILALAPLGPDIKLLASQNATDSLEYVELFWVEYPEARETLQEAKICSDYSNIKPSFEELLSARRFSSIIYKENDPYGNRAIEDYSHKDAYIEGERIKGKIREREQQMWSP
jgi:gliding motility associated protien GldN